MLRRYIPAASVAVVLLSAASTCVVQLSGSVQGNVLDPSGAAIPNASVTLTDLANSVQRTATTDSSGVYRFLSLAPGRYTISATSSGFSKSKTDFSLRGNENRDVPLTLAIGDVGTQVSVDTQAPLLDTSGSRNQYTLDSPALSTLPLAPRNPFANIGLAPGVTGGLDSQGNLNYAPENFIDTSANGRGENGNVYVVDGLDVTSNVRPGVVNLTPNADSVQEVNVQTNTYSVQYGRGSGIQTVVTTKSGTNQFRAFASELYTWQGLYAKGIRLDDATPPVSHQQYVLWWGRPDLAIQEVFLLCFTSAIRPDCVFLWNVLLRGSGVRVIRTEFTTRKPWNNASV